MPRDLFQERGIDLFERSKQPPEGMLSKLGHGYLNYAKGALRGTGQALGDLGASAITLPISGIENLTGTTIPHVPHPDLLNKSPGSLSESIGQSLGELTGGIGLPIGAGAKAVQLANKGYKAIRSGKELSRVGKLIASGLGGAGEGYLGNEEDRGQGAKVGAALGLAGEAVPAAINFGRSLTSKNIAKSIQEEFHQLEDKFRDRFTHHLESGEAAGANKHLTPEEADISLLRHRGKNSELVKPLEEYNKNPTLKGAHEAQSNLGKIERRYKSSEDNAAIYHEAKQAKNRLLQKISQGFENSGVPEHGQGYGQARADFATESAPYLNNRAISGLIGRTPTGQKTVREENLVKLFSMNPEQAEEFLTRRGFKHPGLKRRTKLESTLKHPVTKAGLAVGGGIAASYLPYYIAKALGLR